MPARRKASHPAEVQLPPLRLFVDDIEELVEKLEKLTGKVDFDVARYVVDCPADLTEIPDSRVESLSIETQRPRVHVEIGTVTSRIRAYDDDVTTESIVGLCQSILLRSRRPLVALASGRGPALFFAGAILLALFASFLQGGDFFENLSTNFLVAACLMFMVSVGILYYALSGRVTIVLTKRRKDSPSWFRANRDNIVLSLVSVVIGAGLSALLTC